MGDRRTDVGNILPILVGATDLLALQFDKDLDGRVRDLGLETSSSVISFDDSRVEKKGRGLTPTSIAPMRALEVVSLSNFHFLRTLTVLTAAFCERRIVFEPQMTWKSGGKKGGKGERRGRTDGDAVKSRADTRGRVALV